MKITNYIPGMGSPKRTVFLIFIAFCATIRVFCVAPVLALPSAYSSVISAGVLIPPLGTVDIIPGRNGLSETRIVIRNDLPGTWPEARPIVLRRVYWGGQKDSAQVWLRPMPGFMVNLENGRFEYQSARTIAHTIDSMPMTEEQFETGFLPAGHTLVVGLPRPQPTGPVKLVIRYAIVPEDAHILLPEDLNGDRKIYSLPEPSRLRAYEPGTPVLIFPRPLKVRETQLTISVPSENPEEKK